MVALFIHSVFGWYGWTALAAIGTLGLAAVTLSLVLATRRLAKFSATDVRSQWRPLLLVRGAQYPSNRVTMTVANIGRGPALDVRGELDGLDKLKPGIAQPVGAIVDVGGTLALEWSSLENTSGVLTGAIVSSDISGWTYVSRFGVSRTTEPDPMGVKSPGPARVVHIGFDEQEPFDVSGGSAAFLNGSDGGSLGDASGANTGFPRERHDLRPRGCADWSRRHLRGSWHPSSHRIP